MKAAVIVLSDPKNGSEEALGRVFNALSAVKEMKEKGDDVTLIFSGTGTRWSGELTKAGHPAAELFATVRDKVAGVSCGCADIFGATEDAEKNGFDLRTEFALPGTRGVASYRDLVAQGYTVLSF